MLKPPPNLKGSEWADNFFYISPEVGTGVLEKWKTLPYQKGILDAFTDPNLPIVCVKKSSRVGFTLMAGAFLGCCIHNNPRNTIMAQPTTSDAEDWSKDFLDTMIRDVPVLAELSPKETSRNKDNTILRKKFPGMKLYAIGSESPRGFRRINAGNIVIDEYSGQTKSAGKEGEQLFLLQRRQESHLFPKMIVGSTPTIEGECKISDLFEQSDKRYCHVPCKYCGHMQILKWSNIDYSKKGTIESPVYICEDCQKAIEYKYQRWMIERCEWIATAPYKGIAGFFIWSAYSYNPNASWAHIVDAHLKAGNDPIKRKTWVNTWLGETWIEGDSETFEEKAMGIYTRREYYEKVPLPCGVLFASVDTQDDRLECLVKAWAKNEESYNLEKIVFIGNVSTIELWEKLDIFLLKTYEHENGQRMNISGTVIDTGGHHADEAYNFVRDKEDRNIFAIKGHAQAGKPVIMPPAKGSAAPVDLYMIGTYAAKDIILSRLKIPSPGPGYIHFNYGFDLEHCKQVVAERKSTKMIRGQRTEKYEKIYNRNEALDLEVYGLAILRMFFPDMYLLNEYIDSVLSEIPIQAEESQRKYRSRGII